MAKLFNRAKVLTATTGTGTITLGNADGGYLSFADAGVANGDVVRYVIEEGDNFEIGTGTYSSTGPTLTRTPSQSSEANNAKITLAGEAVVFITATKEDFVNTDGGTFSGNVDFGSGIDVTGNITVTGTVDGRDIANDGSKLDNIESNATADQTAAEIRSLVEAATNSNVFTDADHTKLNNIEDNANNYSLPLASPSARGGVKTGYAENGKNYPVELSNEKMFVNVPWTDTNTDTTYSFKAQATDGNNTNPNLFLDASTGTDDSVKLVGSGATTVTRNGDGQITISSTDTNTDTNTTYSFTATQTDSNNTDPNLHLNASAGTDYNIQIVGDGATTVTRNSATKITISSTDTNTNTNTTYSMSVGQTGGTNADPNLNLVDSSSTTDAVQFTGTGATSVARIDNDTIQISSTDTNTTYSAGSGLSLSGTTFSHTDTSSQASVNNSNGTVIQDVTLDTYGHVTALTSYNLDNRYYTETEAEARFLRSNTVDLYTPARLDFGSSGGWDAVGFSNQTNLHFRDHNQFWIGAGNGTWFTGTANTKSQASGLAADAAKAHDLLITTMQSDNNYDRGITFGADNNGNGNNGWRLGKWHSGDARDSSKLVVDGGLFVKGGYTDEYDYYTNDYSAYYSSRGGQAFWGGDSNWNDPSATFSTAIQIQSGNAGTNTRNPEIQFHQYGYGGVRFRYDGPNDAMHLESTGSNRYDYFRNKTDHGYIDFGPMNTSHAHINTDRSNFYFNKELRVDTGVVRSYDEDLNLNRAGSTTARMIIGSSTTTDYQPREISTSTDNHLTLSGSSNPYILFEEGTTTKAYMQWHSGGYLLFRHRESGTGQFVFRPNGSGDAVRIRLEASDGDVYGSVYADHNNDIGFLDDDNHWAYRHRTDSIHEWRINNTVEMDLDSSALDLKGNNLEGVTNIYLSDVIYHTGDTNTYLQFDANDSWRVVTGGTERLKVSGDNIDIGGAIRHRGDTNTYIQFHASDQWRVVTNGTERLEVNDVQITAAVKVAAPEFVANSDINLKENIVQIDDALSKLNTLNGYTYNFIDNPDAPQAGLIAQEVQKVLPEVVQEGEDGNLGLNYNGTIALLVEAIKDQQRQIDELTRKLEE